MATTARHITERRLQDGLLASVVAVLFAVPLAFSVSLHRVFTLPKILLLLVFCPVVCVLLAALALKSVKSGGRLKPSLLSTHSILVISYMGVTALSTALGVAPHASLWGSFENQMGLVTRVCFAVCFAGLLVGIGNSAARFIVVLWAIALSGTFVAAYAVTQFYGWDPFLPRQIYTFPSPSGPIVRVCGTLGHSNYLANFLLFTTPISAAMAFAYEGRARRIASMALALSAAAVIFSGTRGGWLGLAVAALVFLSLELSPYLAAWKQKSRRAKAAQSIIIAAAFTIILVTIGLIPTARTIAIRAHSVVTDGLTGSGRTLLWRDTLEMLPDYIMVGCGPEGFRKAFLPYKSKELARLAPQTNNESSHNSYLDEAVSLGILGIMLYAGIALSSLSLLYHSRKHAPSRELRLLISGIIASFAGVGVHKLFIFDQIPTGLYFFAFVGLAGAALNVVRGGMTGPTERPKRAPYTSGLLRMALASTVALAVAATWYGLKLLQTDVLLKQAYGAALSGQLEQTVRLGKLVAEAPDPSRNYRFEAARAITFAIASAEAGKPNAPALRRQAIDLAREYADESKAFSLTPDSSNLLIAYLAFQQQDFDAVRQYALEALRLDPYYANTHWLMGEYYFAKNEKERALQEVKLALEIHPDSKEAVSLRKRIRGDVKGLRPDEMVQKALVLIREGRYARAEHLIRRAERRSGGNCGECDRARALIREARAR